MSAYGHGAGLRQFPAHYPIHEGGGDRRLQQYTTMNHGPENLGFFLSGEARLLQIGVSAVHRRIWVTDVSGYICTYIYIWAYLCGGGGREGVGVSAYRRIGYQHVGMSV